MKNLLTIFAILVLISCHPDPAEGNPLTMEDGRPPPSLYSSSSLSSSSLRSSSSSSLRSSSSLLSSSSYVSSSSSLLSSSGIVFCIIGTNCLTIGKDVEKEYCWQNGQQVTSCPRSSSSSSLRSSSSLSSSSSLRSSSSSSISSSSACVNPPSYSSFSTVTIGEQTWMAENLNYAACGSVCHSNQESNCEKYGRLYNWAMAVEVCPEGWHLPTKDEWDILSNSVGGGSTDGKHLKADSGWPVNGEGLDTYGFAALPGGYCNYPNDCLRIAIGGYWWSNSDYDYSNHAYDIDMVSNNDDAYWNHNNKGYFLSVRCVKDEAIDFSILPEL